jgi:hypothetical protein
MKFTEMAELLEVVNVFAAYLPESAKHTKRSDFIVRKKGINGIKCSALF